MFHDKIDSPQNPTIKAAAKLRSSRARRKTAQIIIDGAREIQRAAAAGVTLQTLFLPEDYVPGKLQPRAEHVFTVSRRAHQKIAFGNRLEPVAIAARPNTALDRLDAPSANSLYVVLDSVEKPGNIGAVVRTADGAGLDAVLLVNSLADPFNPNAIRASLGTVFSVPLATCSFDTYATWSKRHDIRSLLAVCDPEAVAYDKLDYSSSTALVLGNEANGLNENWVNLGNIERVGIPMLGVVDSLNVSAAAAVLIYEANRHRNAQFEKK